MEREPSTGERVAANVRDLRRARGMTLDDLSDRLDEVGHPLAMNVLSKVETRNRRVDVEDLTALAVALDCSPNLLLLTPGAEDDESVAIAGRQRVSARTAWEWATGEAALPDGAAVLDLDRLRRFRLENRPHDGPELSFEPDQNEPPEMVEQRAALDELRRAYEAARSAGVDEHQTRAVIRLTETMFRWTGAGEVHGIEEDH